MIITCPNCRTRYMVAAQAIGVEGRKVRCAACKHTWFQDGEAFEAEPLIAEEALAAPADKAAVASKSPIGDAGSLAQDDPAPATMDTKAQSLAEQRQAAEFAHKNAELPQMPMGALIGRGDAKALRQKKPAQKKKGTAVGFPRGKKRRMARWFYTVLITLLFCALIGLNLIFWRDKIVGFVPQSAEIYTRLGLLGEGKTLLEQPITTLRLSAPRTGPRFERNGQTIQTVMGTITNPTGKALLVPPLKGTLRDAGGKIVYEWTFRAPLAQLGSGETVAFESEIIGLPASAQSLLIEFDTAR